MITKKTNKILINARQDELGEYINGAGARFVLNTASQINAPDGSDLSAWVEYDSLEKYLADNGLKHEPLPEEEIRRIVEARK